MCSIRSYISALFTLLLIVPTIVMASTEALVIADEAVLYSDIERSSPVGFFKKGKIIKVAKPQNRGLVYPTVVSNKIVYISAEDVTLDLYQEEILEVDAERFRKVAKKSYSKNSLSFLLSSQQATLAKDTKADQDKDIKISSVGFLLRGEQQKKDSWFGVAFIAQYLRGETEDKEIRNQEIGLGLGPVLALINSDRIRLRAGVYPYISPFYQYELDSLFKVNGYAVGGLLESHLQILITRNLGLDIQGSFLARKVMGLDFPAPYKNYNPMVVGAIMSAGLCYQF